MIVNAKKVLYLQYTNSTAYPPLENSSRILGDLGYDILFFGIRSSGTGNFTFKMHDKIIVELMNSEDRGIKQKLHFIRYIWKSFMIARAFKPDWIYVSDMMATPVGLFLKKIGYKIIYHEHDSPSSEAGSSLLMKWVNRCRNSLALKADMVVVPQHQRIQFVKQDTGSNRPFHCVWNCPLKADIPDDYFHHERQAGEPLKLYYHGSINLERIPLTLIEGAKRSGVPIIIRAVGYETIGSSGASNALRKAASGSLVNLELPGSFSHFELREQIKGMHVGWNCYKNESNDLNLQHLAGASNKSFDYLSSGLALIVNDSPEWIEMFETPGYARSTNSHCPDSIANTLRWLYENPSLVSEMGQKGRDRIITDWNYEKQFETVLTEMGLSARK